MAMTNEQLMIELGLDATKVTKSISQLKTDLKSLEKQRALSKTEADLDVVNRKIKIVEGQITRLKNIGFDSLEKSSKGARTAVTNLSLAVQDLPFGFIGIQNNLPGVIQGFGNLTSSTNGKIIPALKEVKNILLGPAGIFLAFSIVSSAITIAVQKYGSLGNAIDALLGKQTAFKIQLQEQLKALDEYNKKQQSVKQLTDEATASQAGQIAIIDSLVRAATDENKSLKEKQGALNQLNTINKDYFGNLKTGAGDVDKIRQAAEKYTKVLIAQAKVKALSNEIDNIAKLNVKNEELLAGSQENLKTDKQKYEVNKALFPILYKIRALTTGLNSDIKDSEESINQFANSIFDLNNKGQKLADSIDEINKELIKNTVTTDDATKSVKKYFEAYRPPQEYLDFIRAFDDISKFQRGQDLFSDLGNIDFTKGENSVTKFNEVIKTLQQDFPNLFEGFGVSSAAEIPKQFTEVRAILKNALDNLAGYIVQEGQSGRINKAAGTLADAYFGSTEQIRNGLKKAREAAKKALNEYQPLDTSNVFGKGPGSYEQVMAPLIKMQEDARKATLKFVQDTRDAANLLNGVFFQPLQDQFKNLFDTGKFSFREFGKAIVENMKQVVAKLIATGIIALLATIATTALNPGAAAATKLTGFQIFSRAFAGQLGFGPQRGPNLANIGAGGLAMSGAVNLTLRGSDLVGALNRTNTNINRIG